MDKKKLLLVIACIICFVISATIVIMNVFDIHLNVITYHSLEQDGYSFTFKGSSGEVRKVVIKKDSKKLGAFPFNSASDVFDTDKGYSAEFIDVNFDGVADLSLPCAIDADGDVHSSIFLIDGSGKITYNEKLSDLSNVKLDPEKKLIFTEFTSKEVTEEASTNNPEFYETRHVIQKHAFIDGEFITLEERAINYYAENDYYCYSVYEYDKDYGGLKYVDEKWFDPDKLDNYPLNWD